MSIAPDGSSAGSHLPPQNDVPPAPAPARPEAAGEAGFPRDRRFIFVQLLFSLAAAEISRQGAELVLQGRGVLEASPAYAHLLLALIVVASSWVGWSISAASLRLKVSSVFSLPFVALLFDVVLVTFYFILVRGAEIPKHGDPLVPSARTECVMMALIFAGYFGWDVLTKAVASDASADAPSGFLRRFFGPAMWSRGWTSFLCMALGIVAWWSLRSVSSVAGVLFADASLLFLILLFRAMKEQKPRAFAVTFSLLAIAAGLVARSVG